MLAFKPWRLGLGQDFQIACGAKNIAEINHDMFPFYVIEKAKKYRCVSQIPIVIARICMHTKIFAISMCIPSLGTCRFPCLALNSEAACGDTNAAANQLLADRLVI